MLFTIFTVLLCAFQAQAKAVFAHFMVYHSFLFFSYLYKRSDMINTVPGYEYG